MKKVVQGLVGNLQPADLVGWKRWADKFVLLDDMSQADPEVPLVGGLNLANKPFRHWIQSRRPYFCFNRPHLGGHSGKYSDGARRISVNSYAATTLGAMPHSRWATLKLPKHDWKVTQVQNVLIAPPSKSVYYWTGETAEQWAKKLQDWFVNQGANVRVRLKNDAGKGKGGRYKTLWEDLDWADLVVSYSSAITTEAFWYGKKVISLGVCPTWTAAARDLEDWANPAEPLNRDIWHEHIAWTQFDEIEWASGEAQELTVAYQGWPLDISPPDNPFV